MGISHKIAQVPFYVSLGISQGIMPLISYNYSSRNGLRTKKVIRFTQWLSCSFLVVMAVILSVFSRQLMAAFIQTESIIDYGQYFLVGMSIAMPFLAMDFIGVAVYQACGMGSKSFLFAVMRKIILEIPALFVLNWLFPLYGLAYAQFFAEFILACIAVYVLQGIIRDLPMTEPEHRV